MWRSFQVATTGGRQKAPLGIRIDSFSLWFYPRINIRRSRRSLVCHWKKLAVALKSSKILERGFRELGSTLRDHWLSVLHLSSPSLLISAVIYIHTLFTPAYTLTFYVAVACDLHHALNLRLSSDSRRHKIETLRRVNGVMRLFESLLDFDRNSAVPAFRPFVRQLENAERRSQ